MFNSFGNIFRLTSFGESHGPGVGGVIDGFPAGITIDMDFIQQELNRRRPGQSLLTTSRQEPDKVEFLSGIFEGKSTGCPIGFVVWNKNQHSTDYENIRNLYRPSHADYTYLQKQISLLYGVQTTYVSDLEHSGVDLPALEKGSIYVREGVEGEKFVIAGKSYKIAGHIKVEVSDEMLEDYMMRYYGTDITESLESYIGYMYGIYGIDDWLYQQKPGYYDGKDDLAEADYKDFLVSKEKEYNSFVASVRNDCASSNFFTLPAIIMTREDMEDISITYSVGKVGGLSSSIYSGGHYVFYSYDADALGEELVAEYGEDNVTTTKLARQTLRGEYYGTFVMLAIMLVIVCAVLSLCLYFIMRSALLGDIKEVGISRAIGVSRKNLCYRYFVETMVLFALTIFVGYLLTSWLMAALSAMGSGLMMIVYYPWWIALAALALIFAVTTVCGQLPIRTLLRRTPAEILAKYDI